MRRPEALFTQVITTQLSTGTPGFSYGICRTGPISAAFYRTRQDLAVCFRPSAERVVLTVQEENGAVQFDGIPRNPRSVLLYWDTEPRDRVGLMPASRGDAPRDGGHALIVPKDIILNELRGGELPRNPRGWIEAPVHPELATRIIDEIRHRCAGDDKGSAMDLSRFVPHLCDAVLVALDKGHAFNDPSDYSWLIARLTRCLDALEPGSSLTLAQAGELTGASVRTLQRAFQTVLGVSLGKFIRHHRLGMARRILVQQDQSLGIGRAAFLAGFQHASRFAMHYRNLYGELPSRWEESPPSSKVIAPPFVHEPSDDGMN